MLTRAKQATQCKAEGKAQKNTQSKAVQAKQSNAKE
jgi:hypothetical protein